MKISKSGSEAKKFQDYFKVQISWEGVYGNGDGYDGMKNLFLRAASVDSAIRKAKRWWKCSKEGTWYNFDVVAVEQMSYSATEMLLAVNPPMKRKEQFAIVKIFGGQTSIIELYTAEDVAQERCQILNGSDSDGAWYIVKPAVKTVELSQCGK